MSLDRTVTVRGGQNGTLYALYQDILNCKCIRYYILGPHELGDIGGMVKVVKYHFTLFSFYLVLFFVESIPVNLSLC